MTGLLITTYNRPEYFLHCIRSIQQLEDGVFQLLIVDDASADEDLLGLIEPYPKIVKPVRNGISNSILIGMSALAGMGCDILINLDSDAVVKPDFNQRVVKLLHSAPYPTIVSGFNTLVPDAGTGRPRHPIVKAYPNFVTKRSIGGINMCMHTETFFKIVLPELRKPGHWDWNVCAAMQRQGKLFFVTKPSVVQHIGIDSTFADRVNPDVAHDFA